MTREQLNHALSLEQSILNQLQSEGPVHAATLEVGMRRMRAIRAMLREIDRDEAR